MSINHKKPQTNANSLQSRRQLAYLQYQLYDQNKDKGLFTLYRELQDFEDQCKNIGCKWKSKSHKRKNKSLSSRRKQQQDNNNKINTERKVKNVDQTVIIKVNRIKINSQNLRQKCNVPLKKYKTIQQEQDNQNKSQQRQLNLKSIRKNISQSNQSNLQIFKQRNKHLRTQLYVANHNRYYLPPNQLSLYKPPKQKTSHKYIQRYKTQNQSIKKTSMKQDNQNISIKQQHAHNYLPKIQYKKINSKSIKRVINQTNQQLSHKATNKIEFSKKTYPDNDAHIQQSKQSNPYKFVMISNREYQKMNLNEKTQLSQIIRKFCRKN